MIHFDLEDRYQDELVVGSAISRREGVVLSVIFHGGLLLLLIFGPRLPLFRESAEDQEQQRIMQQARQDQNRTFVFVQPPNDLVAPRPPERAPLSDLDRRAQTRERAPTPSNPLPFSRGTTTEQTESGEKATPNDSPEPPSPTPPEPQPQQQQPRVLPRADEGLSRVPDGVPPNVADAFRNLERSVRPFAREKQTFNNPQGGATSPGSDIQFDTKGVDFGWWIRRFVAQVRRNWFLPDAAMAFHGHVVLQFNIHKDGRITDLIVLRPAEIEGFTRAAVNAITGSNPTAALPPEYPDEKALFTVTFYYNEQPPGQ